MLVASQRHPLLVSRLPAVGSNLAWPTTSIISTFSDFVGTILLHMTRLLAIVALWLVLITLLSYFQCCHLCCQFLDLRFQFWYFRSSRVNCRCLPLATIHHHQDLGTFNKFIKICCVLPLAQSWRLNDTDKPAKNWWISNCFLTLPDNSGIASCSNRFSSY